MPLNNWESDEMWEIAVTATSRDSAEILQVQALPWAWTCPERPWWEGTFNVPPECQLYVVHGMNWLTCRCTKVKKDGLIYWSRKGTVSLTEMCCQMMAGRAAKSPPDWLLYLPPDPSPPGLWQVRSKGRFTCGCELGSCVGKADWIESHSGWLGPSTPPLPAWGWRAPQPTGCKGGSKDTSPCRQSKEAPQQATPANPEMLPLPFPICSLLWD